MVKNCASFRRGGDQQTQQQRQRKTRLVSLNEKKGQNRKFNQQKNMKRNRKKIERKKEKIL